MQGKNRTIKWLARILGLLGIAFFTRFLIIRMEGDWMVSLAGKLRPFAILMLFGIAGYVFAWFREKEGGLVLIFSGMLLGLYLFYSGSRPPSFVSLIYGLPFMIPGLLFYYTAQQEDKDN